MSSSKELQRDRNSFRKSGSGRVERHSPEDTPGEDCSFGCTPALDSTSPEAKGREPLVHRAGFR